MADRPFQELKTLGAGRIMLAGRFAPNGTGAATDVRGAGLTVARTGVGTFVVTLKDTYPIVLWADARLVTGALTVNTARVVAVPSPGKSLTIVTADATPAATDIAAGANTFVMFAIVLSNSTIALGG